MITAIIVDDEPSAAKIISALIKAEHPEINISGTCTTIAEAVTTIAQKDPDILFLDVELAEGTGFDILEKFPSLRSRVIFVTAHDHYSLKAIKHHAFDYVLKPVDPAEFRKTLSETLRSIQGGRQENPVLSYFRNMETKKIAIPDRSGYKYYDIDKIILLEAEGSYTRVHLTDTQPLLISKGLRDFEMPLHGKGFLRVHKSYFINTMHIAEWRKEDGGYLLMSNALSVPISPKNREDILSRLRDFTRLV